jgi:ribosomal protein S18 acetylase RimI-like enzyme
MSEPRIVMLDGENFADVESLNQLYCEVWKEPPWEEFFWTHEIVEKYIDDTRSKPNSIWLLIKTGEQLIGFALGYEVDQVMMQEISGHSGLDHLFDNKRRVFYDAEVAVLTKHRRNGLGSKLILEKVRFAKQVGCQTIVVRTKAESAKIMLTKLGFHDTMISDGSDPERTYWQLEL